ncbi:hypothetical protein [Jeotgalibacillus malaysiensis]|uniref:hypothetical protein n=1 Tax=Jeotgalibacillus malaysiensis TaxID=1508404 RepID=UPI00384DA80F
MKPVVDTDGTLNAAVLTFSKISGTGNETVTADTGAFNNLTYVVTVADEIVETTSEELLPEFVSNTMTASDRVAPTVNGVEKLNAFTV